MKTHVSAKFIARAIGKTVRGVNKRVAREAIASRKGAGRGGGREYAIDSLPAEWRAPVAAAVMREARAVLETPPSAPPSNASHATPAPLAGLSGRAKARAGARLAILAALDSFRALGRLSLGAGARQFALLYNAREIEIDADTRAAIPKVSRASLLSWRRLAKTGAARLAGAYKREPRNRIDLNPALHDLILSMLLHQPHLGAHHILANLRGSDRLPREHLPSLRRLQAWLARWKAANASLFAHASNPDAARGQRLPAFGGAGDAVVRLNQLWETDATPADVLCSDGRHAVIGVIDVATRRAALLVAKTSKAVAVGACLRKAILAWGIPEAVKSDRGKEFLARHVAAALAALEITHIKAPPFTPQAKPHIERFFGTLTRDLFERLPGFAGHDVAGRQELRAQKTFAARHGEADSALLKVAMTAAELQAACDSWLAAVYERGARAGLDGRTPFAVAAGLAAGARRVADVRALDMLLAEAPGDGWRVVGKKGISAEGGRFIAPELGAMVGERVQVRLDAADMGRVYVYSADGRFVCVAEDHARAGAGRAAVAAAAKANYREGLRVAREDARRRAREHRPEDIIREVLANAEAQAAKVVAFPHAGRAHTTPALDEAARAAGAAADIDALKPDAASPFQPGPRVIRGLTPEEQREVERQWDAIERGPVEKPPVTYDEQGRAVGWRDEVSWAIWAREQPRGSLSEGQIKSLEQWENDSAFRDLLEFEIEARSRKKTG